MQHDCSETQQALQEVMDDPIKLRSVCLEEAAEAIHVHMFAFHVDSIIWCAGL